MQKTRNDVELPEAIEEWGWQYHHAGIPAKNRMPCEKYIPQFKFHVSGFNTSPFGIDWMRFDANSPVDRLIQTVPHIAFEVTDLDYELTHRGFKVITEPDAPDDGIRVAMIEHNGAPVELIEFSKQ